MSEMTGVNRQTIATYLRGTNPSATNRLKMANGLLATSLETAGWLPKKCEECGIAFTHDPNDRGRRFCKRKCNVRWTANKHQAYQTKYVLGRVKHDLEDHIDAVARFCDWCTGSETKCPEPRSCPLAGVSPYNYDNQTLIQPTRLGILPRGLDTTEGQQQWAVARRSVKTSSS